MQAQIVKEKISKEELSKIMRDNYGEMVKVAVDVKRGVLAVGGEWHSEGDEILNQDGSSRENVWGINFYPWKPTGKRIEYHALINLKPSVGHTEMEILDSELKQEIKSVIEKLLLSDDETL